MNLPKSLGIDVYFDGANIDDMARRAEEGFVKGFTTNPTLMAKAGIRDYEAFAKEALKRIPELPISFEVFSDDLPSMKEQALRIASWGKNVFVKIPVSNTKGERTVALVQDLLREGAKLNITAVFTHDQVRALAEVFDQKSNVIVSIFAGRIADTGVDPIPHMIEAKKILSNSPGAKLLWASPREVLNIYQAAECGCEIITVTEDLLKKLSFRNKDLNEFSLETVKVFYNDAQSAGFQL